MRTYPFMPNVDGNSHDTYFQKAGILAPGHDMPERKSSGTDRNTKSMIQSSRRHTRADRVMAMKMQASRYGTRKARNVV